MASPRPRPQVMRLTDAAATRIKDILGKAERPIAGVRKSIIVNYVGPEWRSRHELAFPDEAVVSANNG